jgi:hypothetical protein
VRWLGLVAVCGCNWAYGLDETHLPADAPPDAPFRCPSSVGTPPTFSTLVTQAVLQECFGYSVSVPRDLAVAVCDQNRLFKFVAEGNIDKPLERSELAPPPIDPHFTRLVPEGTELYVHEANNVISRYRRTDKMWTRAGPLVFPGIVLTGGDRLGAPSRGPQRHVMLRRMDGALHEFIESANDGSWTLAHTYTANNFGVSVIDGAADLSPDGTKVTFPGSIFITSEIQVGVFYADRAMPSAMFGKAIRLAGTPAISDPFLTQDCARIYFSGLSSIFYSQQLRARA